MEQQTPQAPVTVEALDALVKEISDKKTQIEVSELATTALNKELMGLQAKATNYLKALGREDFKSPFGSIRIAQKWRVSLPKTDEDKAMFFAYLREKNIFDSFATVNSNSLNSYFLAEWEAAKKVDGGMDFTLPGIGAAKMFEALSYRR